MEYRETDIVILGGGLTGLSIADLLTQTGKNVILLEKENCVGGLARTVKYDGFRFDLGGHRLCFYNSALLNYIKSILGDNSLICHKRESSIFLNGKFLKYPPKLFNCFSYSFPDVSKIIFENFFSFIKKRDHLSLKGWLTARFGATIHNIYFRDYSQKVWGLSTDEMSADWARRRIGHFDFFQLIKETFIRLNSAKENNPIFYYPSYGIGMICDALFERIKNKAQVILDVDVSKITYSEKRLHSLIYRKNGDYVNLKFRHLISTIPLVSLCQLIFPLNEVEINNLYDKIRYRNLILVYLTLNQEKVVTDHWIYFPGRNTPFSRISEPKNWSGQMAYRDKTSLCIELFCGYKDRIWGDKNEKIIEMAIDSLEKLNVISRKRIYGSFVLRVPFAYPLLYLGYQDQLNPIFKQLSKFKNLKLVGRTGAHSYYDMEECLIDAQKAVNKIT